VTENSGTSLKAEIESASFTGIENPGGTACKSSITIGGNAVTVTVEVESLPWCLYSEESGKWDLRGKKCSLVTSTTETPTPIEFTLKYFEKGVTARSKCHYKTTADIGGTYVTNTSPLVLTITKGGPVELVPSLSTFSDCSHHGSLSGTFTVTESGGGALKAS
jgi:hypothetical protein